MSPNSISFALNLMARWVLNFLPTAAQKVSWTDRDAESGAGLKTLQHHSLDPYGGHEMVQHHHTLWNVSKQHPFSHKFNGKVLNFLPTAAQTVAWINRDGESGAGLTLQQHSLDPYGGHEMVQQHHTLWNVSKQHQFCPKFDGKVAVMNFLPVSIIN
jgi:hypothetical protein